MAIITGTSAPEELTGTTGSDIIHGNDGDDTIFGSDGNDNLFGDAGDDVLYGENGDDYMDGGIGNDTYYIDQTGDSVYENPDAGIDLVITALTSYNLTSANNVENLEYSGSSDFTGTGNSLANSITGGIGNDSLSGSGGNDTLDGGLGGNDTLVGGTGDDNYYVSDVYDPVANTGDRVIESANQGNDTVYSTVNYTLTLSNAVENLTLLGTAAEGYGNTLPNILKGNNSVNILVGYTGDDIYYVQNSTDTITEAADEGNDSVFSSVNYTLSDNVDNLELTGSANINGTGNALDNSLTGNSKNNTLDGKEGADSLYGGRGNDIYIVDDAGDIVDENSPVPVGTQDTDIDEVQSSINYTLGNYIENLTLTATTATTAAGNSLNNLLTGNSVANSLDGGEGADILNGGLGDDFYTVQNTDDVIVESNADSNSTAGGIDTVSSSVSYTLPSTLANGYVEKLTLTGTDSLTATGNELANTLTGNSGANTLTGGLGNDIYYLQNSEDKVIEKNGEGTDLVYNSVSYSLDDFVENLELQGVEAINGYGNSSNNQLKGNLADNSLTGLSGNDTLLGLDGKDTLDGGEGVDSMDGGAGDDTYIVDIGTDQIIEASDGGIDEVQSSITYTLNNNYVENLTLTGTANINGYGNSQNNIITGNAGVNIFDGGLGNDVYYVQNANDQIREDSSLLAEIDEVRTSISYTLLDTAYVEYLTLTGSDAVNGTGNSLNNYLIGNSAANSLDGADGIDTLQGGTGNDTYIVGTAGEIILENSGEGTDTVNSSISYTLGNDLENLTLLGNTVGSATNGYGNSADNVITGNAVDNILDGKTGADSMLGGLGNDNYFVDSTGDVITENPGEGAADVVYSAINYELGDNVENLTLISGAGAINGTGNTDSNIINGNESANILDGGSGADNLAGGSGNDTYLVDHSDDSVVETSTQLSEIDLVKSSVSYVLSANVENLMLTGTNALNGTGNSSKNKLTGNDAANSLDGGAGIDTLSGGLGNDTYLVDNSADTIIESASGGTDKVNSSASYVLAANVENLTLTGSAAIAGTGNDSANIITGNSAANNLKGMGGADTLNGGSGADTLDGGAGLDVMKGGLGNDVYFVDASGDTVTELSGEGTDRISSAITLTLPANVENLVLTGDAAINGFGNAGNNSLTGNAAANALTDTAGNNTLIGGIGNDTLTGGTGSDSLSGGLGADDLKGGAGIDTLNGGAGNDIYYINSTGNTIIESSTVVDEIDEVKSSVSYTLANTNVENLTLTSTTALNGGGNTLKNTLQGNDAANKLSGDAGDDTLYGASGNDSLSGDAGNDVLDGGAGNDSLEGGLGSDTLTGGLGDDTYFVNTADSIIEAAAEGTDTVNSSISFTLVNNVEHLTLTGTAAINGTGNSLANTLTGNDAANSLNGAEGNDTLIGNSGNDTLNGGLGVDAMSGGLGNDTYVVDTTGDSVTESLNQGTADRVNSAISYTLTDNVENLFLAAPAAINGTGNTLHNTLTGNSINNKLNGEAGNDTLIGNAGNDTLDGGVGADTLRGGIGDDVYFINTVDDLIDEKALEGKDTVNSSFSYTLRINLENLVLQGGSAINGIGNSLNNVITGNSAANVLDGGVGADTLTGGLGNDTYWVDSISDKVTENSTVVTQIDTVNSSVDFVLPANVERLTLTGSALLNGTGNSLNNVLTGNSVANLIDGSAGNDTLNGGGGDDNLLGSAGLDRLNGGAGADTLNGGIGADTLAGGLGNDTYIVDSTTDSIIENAGEGIDTVNSAISLTLAANVDQLVLTGTAPITGTGNALNNVLTGNSAANTLGGGLGHDQLNGDVGTDVLLGGDGNDTLNGGLGNDTVTGGLGNDLFVLSGALAGNIDKITDFVVISDTIGLSSTVFNANAVNSLKSANNITASNTSAYLNYDSDSGNLFYDSNGASAGGTVNQIALLGVNLNLTTADFIMV